MEGITGGFKNASLNLVRDFKELSESLEYHSGKITTATKISQKTGKLLKGYQVLIRAKDDVKKFLNNIKPIKWDIKREEISNTLKQLGTSIEEALTKKYN